MNIGKAIAIVMDNHVLSYPMVQGEIISVKSNILGCKSFEEPTNFANPMKSGSMYVPLRIIEVKQIETNSN